MHAYTNASNQFSLFLFSIFDKFEKYTNPKKVEKPYFVPQFSKSYTKNPQYISHAMVKD